MVSDSSSATVNVPLPAPVITLEKTGGANAALCATGDSITLPPGGGAVTYCYRVRNTGNISLTRHDLEDEQLGALLLGFPFTLAPAPASSSRRPQ